MSFAPCITRSPIPFEPARADEIRAEFAGEGAEIANLLGATAACSPYLSGLITGEGDWLRAALADDPDRVLPALFDRLRETPDAGLKPALRIAKGRVALFVALADLAGVWSLDRVTGGLTEFADLATTLAARALTARQIERGKLPGQGPDDRDSCAGLCLVAMGKMGAFELNYSSDIDLISLFDDSRYDSADLGDVRSVFIRITRDLAATLSDLTAEGYVFRTDLRLRPDAAVTPVCLSMAAAETYYESVGRTWERAAHIKARAAAGDIAAGQGYLDRLGPFVWRKHLDFVAIQDAHDIRLRIREHRRLGPRRGLEGRNIKLGAGGIREIEFFTQTRQLIAGGRDPDLRQRGTVAALGALAGKGWVPADIAETLAADYRALREVEHHIQMIADAQTHELPANDGGIARIAALGGREPAEFRADLEARLARVAGITEDFFAPHAPGRPPPAAPGFGDDIIDGWRSYPALRSSRAVEIFARLRPEILGRLTRAADPQQALNQFDRFLAGLPAGAQLFAMFEANPQLIDLIVDIAATAPHLAAYLGRNSAVLDAVIGGDFFAPWPGTQRLAKLLSKQIDAAPDYEARLDAARRWQKEWHFRVGVHQLRALIDADAAGAEYADLADAVLAVLWPLVGAEFALRHGAPPGRGAVVLAMGSLGSSRLTAASDLDLIVIYDARGDAMSDGDRPLEARLYYARLTKALVASLSAPMAEGKLYDVDMRLRPSGRQGPVATSFEAFRNYQQDEAWTWEHLALTRARPVTGNPALMDQVEGFRQSLLRRPHDPKKTVADLTEMRDRIARARPPGGAFEAKLGPGRMQDVELLAQAAALMDGNPARAIPDQLGAATALGWIGQGDRAVLEKSYRLMWQLQSAARLLTGELLDLDLIGQGGAEFLLQATGHGSAAELAADLAAVADAAGQVISTALANPPKLV